MEVKIPMTERMTAEMARTVQYHSDMLTKWLEKLPHYKQILDRLDNEAQMWEVSGVSNYQGVTIMFSGTGDNLSAAFKVLRSEGFTLIGDRPKNNSSEWVGNFRKVLTEEDGKTEKIILYIALRFTSTVCTLTQIGTKLQEVPIYEVVCAELDLEGDESVPLPIATLTDDEIPF